VSSEFTATACKSYKLPWDSTVTQGGDYVHTYTSVNGCDSVVTAHISISAAVSSGENISLCASSYTLPNGSVVTVSGTYTSVLTTSLGCDSIIITNLSLKDPPILKINDPVIVCAGNSVNLTDPAITQGSSSGLQFSYWLDLNATQVLSNPTSVSVSGIYYIKATSTSGCNTIAPVRVRVNAIEIKVTAQNENCLSSGSIHVTATNGTEPYLYSIDGINYQANRVFTNVVVGTYTVYAKDAIGCIGQTIVTISPSPNATIVGGSPICSASSQTLTVTFTGNAPWSLVYSDGVNTHTITSITSSPYSFSVSPTSTTTYSLLSVSDVKCTNNNLNSSTTVTIIPSQSGIRYPDVIAEENVPKQLIARDMGLGSTYQWNPPTGLNFTNMRNPIFKYDSEVEYTITIKPNSGCIIVDTVLVRVQSHSPTDVHSDIFVPKAWSPNNDNHNDRLFPLTVNIKQLYYFRIFNRWGQLMFETSVIGNGWDGNFTGKPQVNDVYTWTLEAVGQDGKYYKRSGNSILLR
jgi:gliding motility-associated-like protein